MKTMALPAQNRDQNAPKEPKAEDTQLVSAGALGVQSLDTTHQPDFDHTKIKSNFVQSPSTYMWLAFPLLGIRYFAEAINDMFKPWRIHKAQLAKGLTEPMESKSLVEPALSAGKAALPEIKSQFAESAWALTVGAFILAVTGFYTSRTYGDMKRQFAQPLSWEFDKPPEKIGFLDMWRSKNVIIHETIKNFAKRTAWRVAVDLPFFAYMLPHPYRPGGKPVESNGTKYWRLLGPKDSVVLGVGTASVYFASDALGRKKSFFEQEQQLIASKINHTENTGEVLTAQDLINLYERQGHKAHSTEPLPAMNTPEWKTNLKLFERMADLMNQTYGNTPKTEQADFTLPKFIYLEGMNLLMANKPEENLAYIEVANRYGIPAVQKVEKAIKSGASLQAALAEYPVNLNVTVAANVTASMEPINLPQEPVTKTFATDALKKSAPETTQETHADRAVQRNESRMTQSPAL